MRSHPPGGFRNGRMERNGGEQARPIRIPRRGCLPVAYAQTGLDTHGQMPGVRGARMGEIVHLKWIATEAFEFGLAVEDQREILPMKASDGAVQDEIAAFSAGRTAFREAEAPSCKDHAPS